MELVDDLHPEEYISKEKNKVPNYETTDINEEDEQYIYPS